MIHAARYDLCRLLPPRPAGYLRFYVSLLLLLLFAACGPLPRPFEPEDKTANPLLAPIEGQTLMVLPIQGQAPALPDQGAEAIAQALAATGLPANAGPRTAQSRLLLGTATVTPLGDGEERVSLLWEVYAPGGSLMWTYRQQADLPVGQWQAGDPGALRYVGIEASPIVEQAARGPELVAAVPELPQAEDGARLPIRVVGLAGAPGDGGRSVPRALRSVLTQRGFLVLDEAKPEGFVVEGLLSSEVVSGNQQKVVLTWRVLDAAAEDAFVGQIQQANVIPLGTLDGAWGDIAAVVAVGAADGVLQLLQQAGKLGGPQPAAPPDGEAAEP